MRASGAVRDDPLGLDTHRYDETMRRARGHAAALDRAAVALAGVRGRARCPRGHAEAVVDGRGALDQLWLADSVIRLPADEVGALIVTTVAAAWRDAQRRRQEVIADLTANLAG